MRGDTEVFAAISEHDRLSHSDNPDANRLIELNDFIAHNDGYTLESRTREMLVGLGIANSIVEQPLSTLSGGFKLRVLLAQVLIGHPDALLLDEPTNHLDILSIRWLELFLQKYTGCAVIISHDRRFLDAVATRILDVDYETVMDYAGNYSKFLEQKSATREQKEREIARAEKIIADKRAFVERFRAKATKARQAQSRLKQIEKIEVEELAQTSRQAPRFRFEQVRPSGRDVLTVEGVSKAYGPKQVLKNVSFEVRRSERVAIIGPNGIGKSTLLKILTDKITSDEGRHAWGYQTSVGYFSQDHSELLGKPELNPLKYVWDACPTESPSYVRGQLGRMLFSGDEVEKPVTALSGGEAARVVFTKICVEKPNVLVLDEPTNHLDMETIDALTEALKTYEGTLLFVSHDRHFVAQLATRIIELRADGLHDFPGSYQDYLERAGNDHLDIDTVVLKAKEEKRATTGNTANRTDLSRDERKKRDTKRKTLSKRRDQLLSDIAAAETEKTEIEKVFGDPALFGAQSTDNVKKLVARQSELEENISAMMHEWETTETELQQLAE
jgi:ATPase subunit of ABC transporter with duplicated ATPase domains